MRFADTITKLCAASSMLVFLVSCANVNPPEGDDSGLVSLNDTLTDWQRERVTTRRGREARNGPRNGAVLRGNGGKGTKFPGDSPIAKPAQFNQLDLNGTVEFDFIDVDIRTATQAILDDILGQGFIIDQNLSGNVTIKTQGPVSKRQALTLLQDLLDQNNAEIVEQNGLFRVSLKGQSEELTTVVPASTDGSPNGSNAQVFRLKHISSTEMATILEPYAGENILGVDIERNALILRGSPAQIESWRQTIRTFDVDWLAGRSVGVFPIESIPASKMIASLEELLRNENTEGVTLARFSVIEANNAVLAITKTPEVLNSIELWIKRLESANGGSVRLFTYEMQHATATSVAPVLAQLFGLGVSVTNAAQPGDNPIAQEAEGEDREEVAEAELGSDEEGGSSSGSSNMRIVANGNSNSLLIFANQEIYERILAALRTIDVPDKQVLVEAVIIEVSLNDDLRHGVQFAVDDGIADVGAVLTENTEGIGIAPEVPGFSISVDTPVDVIVDALDSITKTNVISSPNLMVLNNRTARLLVGEQVPIATQSRADALEDDDVLVNTIEFRDTGVIFDVTPQINSSGSVTLNIEQEISSVPPATAASLTPTFSQRQFSSSILVESGQTVVMGGLFSDSRTETNGGVPGLNRIPVLGNFFSARAKGFDKTELLVLITPHVISNGDDAQTISRELRHRIKELKEIDDALLRSDALPVRQGTTNPSAPQRLTPDAARIGESGGAAAPARNASLPLNPQARQNASQNFQASSSYTPPAKPIAVSKVPNPEAPQTALRNSRPASAEITDVRSSAPRKGSKSQAAIKEGIRSSLTPIGTKLPKIEIDPLSELRR